MLFPLKFLWNRWRKFRVVRKAIRQNWYPVEYGPHPIQPGVRYNLRIGKPEYVSLFFESHEYEELAEVIRDETERRC